MKVVTFLFFACLVFAGYSQNFPIPATTQHAGGTYSIYRNSFTDNITISGLRKSVICVEGFEIITPISISKNYGILNSIDPNTFAPSLASQIHSAGYDIIILNFNDASDQIQRNARVLKDLIISINAGKPTSDPLVIMGYSMGGLVARYALVEMENQNIDHKTRLYISYDAPHKGAHVPASVQSLALTFNSQTWRNLFPELATLLDRFNSPAAQQMLKYRVTSPNVSQTLTVSPTHTAFFNELNALNTNGGFPRNCQSVALSLGSWSGIPQRANFDADGDGKNDFQYSGFPAVYINFPQGSYSGPQSIWNLNLCQGVGAFSFQSFLSTASAVSYPYYATRPNYLSLGDFDYATYWYRNSTGTVLLPNGAWSTINNYANDAEAIDFAPGSLSDTYNQVVKTLSSEINCSFAYYNNSTFIPTVSALAYNTTDLFYKIGEDVNRLSNTPFSDIFAICGENSSHSDQGSIATNTKVVQWVMSKINGQNNPVCFCSTSASITSASNPICATSQLTVNNQPAGTTITWSSSNPSGLSINASGLATRVNDFNGQVTVTATINSGCGSVTLPGVSVAVGSGLPPTFQSAIVTCETSGKITKAFYQGTITQVPGAIGYKWYVKNLSSPNQGYVLKYTATNSLGYDAQFFLGFSAKRVHVKVDVTTSCGNVQTSPLEGEIFSPACDNNANPLINPTYNAVFIYPNPATSVLNIELIDSSALKLNNQIIADPYELHLIDKYQHKIYSIKSSEKTIHIPTDGIPSDTYYLQLYHKDGVIRKQIVIRN